MRRLTLALLIAGAAPAASASQEDERPKVDFSKFSHAREFSFAAARIVPSPDGKTVFTDGGVIKVADWSVLAEVKGLKEMVFSEDGKNALGCTESSGLGLYSLPDWKAIQAGGVGGRFTTCDLSKDRKAILAVGPFPDAICVVQGWDKATPQREVLKGDEMVLARFLDAKRFLTVGKKGGVDLWELGKAAPVLSARAGDDVPAATLAADRKTLFTLCGTSVKKFPVADLKETEGKLEKARPKPGLLVSPKGRYVAVFGGGPLEILEATSLTRLALPTGEVSIGSCAVSPDDAFLLCGDGATNKMYVVSTSDWSVLHGFDTLAPPSAVAIGAKGAWILATTGMKSYAWAPPKKK